MTGLILLLLTQININEAAEKLLIMHSNGAVEIFNFCSPLLCMLVYSGRLIIAPT
jgi:hypothetical protein